LAASGAYLTGRKYSFMPALYLPNISKSAGAAYFLSFLSSFFFVDFFLPFFPLLLRFA